MGNEKMDHFSIFIVKGVYCQQSTTPSKGEGPIICPLKSQRPIYTYLKKLDD